MAFAVWFIPSDLLWGMEPTQLENPPATIAQLITIQSSPIFSCYTFELAPNA